MTKGYRGKIAFINLNSKNIKNIKMDSKFYRTYAGGGAIGSYFLLKHTDADTGALSPENVITIAPGLTTGAAVSGASRFCVTALSPLSNMVGDGQAGGSFGPMLKHAGFDALVLTGSIDELSYIYIEDDKIEIINADSIKGKSVSQAYDTLIEKHGKENISILQCGPAGEKLVRFANLLIDESDVVGRCGLGAVMGSKKIRAVVVKTKQKVEFSDPDSIKDLNKIAAPRLKDSGFLTELNKFGTPGLVKFNAEAGNLPTHNFSRGFHDDHMQLDGSVFEDQIGSGKTTCFGCIVACRKKVKTKSPYNVNDKLGGPEYETLGLLGSNLEIFDAAVVARANEMCNEFGIDTITMGSIAGFLFECMEKGLVPKEKFDNMDLKFNDAKSLFDLIEKTSERGGIGDTIAEGFEAILKILPEESKKYAVHVKGSGLPAHMPQIKPGMALIYSVCPIGPDHMSSEHDWLLASDSEAAKGLGILEVDTASSTNYSKVKMTAYSQLYFSLLDSLCLCMFCWGPGNLFTYRDLVEFVNYCTGWDVSFWELMKIGERRINMMKLINVRRGQKKKDDVLPARVFEKLPDGPGKDRHVDEKEISRMIDEYYSLMSWDNETGMPGKDKLLELGLEWTIE